MVLLSAPVLQVVPLADSGSFLVATELTHPLGLLRRDQIANDVSMGAAEPKVILRSSCA